MWLSSMACTKGTKERVHELSVDGVIDLVMSCHSFTTHNFSILDTAAAEREEKRETLQSR